MVCQDFFGTDCRSRIRIRVPNNKDSYIYCYMDMYKACNDREYECNPRSYEPSDSGNDDFCFCGHPSVKVTAFLDEDENGKHYIIRVGAIDCDDQSQSWDTEVENLEELRRVFCEMVNFYYDIRYTIFDDMLVPFVEEVVLPQLSYATGGKRIIPRGEI